MWPILLVCLLSLHTKKDSSELPYTFWHLPLTSLQTLQWMTLLLPLTLMKIEEKYVTFSPYPSWFPEHCYAKWINRLFYDNTSLCVFLSPFFFSQSHSWRLFFFWAFPLFPQWQLLSLFIFSQGLLLFLSVAFSASLTCSLWLTLSHLHHFHFPTCTSPNLSAFKDLEFPLQFPFCRLQPSLPLSDSSSFHHVLGSLAWPLQWAVVMELSQESLNSSFFFTFASFNIKINKDCLLLPALSASVFRLLSFAWENCETKMIESN